MADPLIAIIGSVHPARAEELKLKKPAEGEQAAKAIGHALASQRCRIVGYSDKGWAVEPLVIRGYVAECNSNETLKNAINRIEVHYSTSDHAPSFPEQDSNPALFTFRPDKNPSWASSFYRSLSQVDGVILMGGSHTTYIAGTVALSHRKPILPLAAFGGAAENLWKELSVEPGVLEQHEIDQMATPNWHPNTEEILVNNLVKHQQRLREVSQKNQNDLRKTRAERFIYVAVPLFIFAFASFPFTWDNEALSKQVLLSLLLISPLLAGISGATARTAFEAVGSVSKVPPNLGRTCGLGAIAGGVAGALFIIAQLVAMSPEIDQLVWSKQAGRLVPFSALIGFIGGLTLDAVFRKLVGVNVISDETLNKLMSDRKSEGRA